MDEIWCTSCERARVDGLGPELWHPTPKITIFIGKNKPPHLPEQNPQNRPDDRQQQSNHSAGPSACPGQLEESRPKPDRWFDFRPLWCPESNHRSGRASGRRLGQDLIPNRSGVWILVADQGATESLEDHLHQSSDSFLERPQAPEFARIYQKGRCGERSTMQTQFEPPAPGLAAGASQDPPDVWD